MHPRARKRQDARRVANRSARHQRSVHARLKLAGVPESLLPNPTVNGRRVADPHATK